MMNPNFSAIKTTKHLKPPHPVFQKIMRLLLLSNEKTNRLSDSKGWRYSESSMRGRYGKGSLCFEKGRTNSGVLSNTQKRFRFNGKTGVVVNIYSCF